MSFGGGWLRRSKPVTQTEESARLQQEKKCSETARSSGTVFDATDSFLEVCDGLYREKGWGLLAFLMAGIGSLIMTVAFIWMATHVPDAVRNNGQVTLAHWVLGLLAFGAFGVCMLSVRSLLVDCFNYTRKPIRFNRIDRTIYAFRHNGPGGVISVPWDSAFLYVERKPKSGLMATAPRVVRCLVLDENGRVTDSFSIGKRVVLASSEEGELGKQAMNELYEDFEYYRRFMQEGPASLPRIEKYLPTEISFWNCLKLQFEDESALFKSGNLFLWMMALIGAIPVLIFSVANYLAQLTCREPVWPEEVERACAPAARPVEGLTT
jgi:hypothetical protein